MPSEITLIHGDCMDGMKKMRDKEFDLAICDPPYGGGATPHSEEDLKDTTIRGGGGRIGKRKAGQGLGVSLTSTKLKLKELVAVMQKNMDQK